MKDATEFYKEIALDAFDTFYYIGGIESGGTQPMPEILGAEAEDLGDIKKVSIKYTWPEFAGLSDEVYHMEGHGKEFTTVYTFTDNRILRDSNEDLFGEPWCDQSKQCIEDFNMCRAIWEAIIDICKGSFNVKWDCWQFSGGRDYGDWTRYSLTKDGKDYGYIETEFEGDYGILLCVYNEPKNRYYHIDVKNDNLYGELDDVIIEALKRDDKEFIERMPIVDGSYLLPTGYEDIDREKVMSKEWLASIPYGVHDALSYYKQQGYTISLPARQ